jgi:hypothetical protein
MSAGRFHWSGKTVSPRLKGIQRMWLLNMPCQAVRMLFAHLAAILASSAFHLADRPMLIRASIGLLGPVFARSKGTAEEQRRRAIILRSGGAVFQDCSRPTNQSVTGSVYGLSRRFRCHDGRSGRKLAGQPYSEFSAPLFGLATHANRLRKQSTNALRPAGMNRRALPWSNVY